MSESSEFRFENGLKVTIRNLSKKLIKDHSISLNFKLTCEIINEQRMGVRIELLYFCERMNAKFKWNCNNHYLCKLHYCWHRIF